MRNRRIAALVLAVLVVSSRVFAQERDLDGAKDHPLVPRLAGGQYFIGAFEEQPFAAHAFVMGTDGEREYEGKFLNVEYWLKEGGKKYGPVEIVRNYRNAFLQKKGVAVYEQSDNAGGRATFRLPIEGRSLWVELIVQNSGEIYRLTFIEEAGMTQNVELTSAAMSAALASTGTITLRGILFETARATIKPESAAVLGEVGKLLSSDPQLQLQIIGHTDNVGGAASNLTLSRQRAEAVKAWLVKEHGVSAARLTATGLGDTKPVADNATEDGRAQNRRVELVKK